MCVWPCRVAFGLVGSWFPNQGSNLGPGSESTRILTTGPAGDSQHCVILSECLDFKPFFFFFLNHLQNAEASNLGMNTLSTGARYRP